MATYLGSLVQLCCGEGGTLQTNTTGMCGECSQWMDHTEFATIQGAYTSRVYTAQSLECSATALSQAALHFMYFTDISHSGSWVLCKGTDLGWLCILCPSQVRTAQVTSAGQAHCPMWAVHLINLPGPCHSVPQVHHYSTVPGVVCVSFGMLISGCDNLADVNHPGSQEGRLANGSLLTVWWKTWSLGLRLQEPLAFRLWLSLACLFASGEGGPYTAAGLLSFGIHSIRCSVSATVVTVWQ